MRRFSAIFVAACMVVIAGSFGALLFVAFQVDARMSAFAAAAVLTGLVLCNAVARRLRDSKHVGEQLADLSRGIAELAQQVGDLSRRLNAVEGDMKSSTSRKTADPLAAEIGELSGIVRQIAETMATHETVLQQQGALGAEPPASEIVEKAAPEPPLALSESDAMSTPLTFSALSVEEIARAVENNSIDLYLQPIVTLPQRKVRYYEAMSRLRSEAGDIVPAGDFIDVAEKAGLMPKIDNLLVFRCVQILRRLQQKSRDVGLFCNISASTLADPIYFGQFLDFMKDNRALAPALTFEFTQGAFRNFGAVEHASLAALAACGFRFSMDHVTDLRIEPKELAKCSFRFLKVRSKLLLSQTLDKQSDIHPEDLADLLSRWNVDLIAERIESETMVLDLLDYDVRFGQGFLFSPPRPVRAEALQDQADKASSGMVSAA